MNITEANTTVQLLRLFDGSGTTGDPDRILEAVEQLAERGAKPLQLQITLDLAEARSTIVYLLQRQADGLDDYLDPGWEDPENDLDGCPACGDVDCRRTAIHPGGGDWRHIEDAPITAGGVL